jgi:hypothetical protein
MSEDILERAKKALIDDDMTYEDYDECISLLIAEVERLRSENARAERAHESLDYMRRHEIASLNARIKELEADRIEARAQYLLFMNDNPGCIAWNFDELDETEQDALREQARYMLELEEPWAYIQLREAREQIKRLEAAFLEAKSRLIQVTENKSNPCGLPLRYTASERNAMAREALERIKAGGKDEA